MTRTIIIFCLIIPILAGRAVADTDADIYQAIVAGDTVKLEPLLKDGANLRKALNAAIAANKIPVVEFLLAHGAKLNDAGPGVADAYLLNPAE